MTDEKTDNGKSERNRRAETAKRNDDSDLSQSNQPSITEQGRSGGNLATKIGTRAAVKRIDDPAAHASVSKRDEKPREDRAFGDQADLGPPPK